MKVEPTERPESHWRNRIHEIVFEAETPSGRAFDIVLIWLIIISVVLVMFESVASVRRDYGALLDAAEWIITVIFTIEYILRLLAVKRPLRYALSFYGVIDFIAIFPSYASLFIPGTQYLLAIRILRLLRIFRILKLTEYISAAGVITTALKASRKKISVFLITVILLVTVIGTAMYVIEGEENGFTDIPTSMYWAIVTLTTVGYGDLSPKTGLGKFLASIVMILGYGIIAVPTGIVTAEMTRQNVTQTTHVCPECHAEGHDIDAVHCKYCGSAL